MSAQKAHSSRQAEAEEKEDAVELRRDIGLAGSVAVIAGIMVGSGIFVSPTGVLAGVNNSVGLSLVVWAGCGVVCTIGALCYCELGSCINVSGGDYNHLRMGYGPVVAFGYAWCNILVARGTSIAALSTAVATYAVEPFYPRHCDPPPRFLVKIVAATVLLALTYINCIGVKVAARLQQGLTFVKFFTMGVIVIGGIARLCLADPVGLHNLNNALRSEDVREIGFSQLGMAFFQGLWAYDGWNELNYVAEEIKSPHKNIPRAILIALPLVTVFYILVNVAYFAVLTPDEILSSEAVASTWATRVLGPFAWIVPLTVCLSTAGALNGVLLSGPRMLLAAARRGHLPKVIAMANVRYQTPTPSLGFVTITGLIYLIPSDFNTLIGTFSFTVWLFYGLSMASVLVMRVKRPEVHRPFKVPVFIPILAVLIAAFLVVSPLVHKPNVLILYAVGFMLSTPFAYYVFVHRALKVGCLDSATLALQKLFQVAPTAWKSQRCELLD